MPINPDYDVPRYLKHGLHPEWVEETKVKLGIALSMLNFTRARAVIDAAEKEAHQPRKLTKASPIAELPISRRLVEALERRFGAIYIADLDEIPPAALWAAKGINGKGVNELRQALSTLDL